jgi:hypothetical protein
VPEATHSRSVCQALHVHVSAAWLGTQRTHARTHARTDTYTYTYTYSSHSQRASEPCPSVSAPQYNHAQNQTTSARLRHVAFFTTIHGSNHLCTQHATTGLQLLSLPHIQPPMQQSPCIPLLCCDCCKPTAYRAAHANKHVPSAAFIASFLCRLPLRPELGSLIACQNPESNRVQSLNNGLDSYHRSSPLNVGTKVTQ